jgi:hypothetical protein
MSWVIDHTGRIAFKGGWTVAADLREALELVLRLREMKREGLRVNPYYKEIMDYKPGREEGPPSASRAAEATKV